MSMTTAVKAKPAHSNAGHEDEHAANCATCALVLREELRFLIAQEGLAD